MQPQQVPPIEEYFGLAVGLRSPWRPSKCTVNEASKTVHLPVLPRGNWIGGTIPNFMAQDGG